MIATIDMGGRHIPQVFALMNMSGNFAAALTPVLVARFFEATNNWNLILFAAIYLAEADCRAFVNPNESIAEVNSTHD